MEVSMLLVLLDILRYPLDWTRKKSLPERYLDYDSMVRHDFLDRDNNKRMSYNLVFSQGTRETITLSAPSLFNLHLGRYIIMPSDIYAYWGIAPPQAPVPELPVEYQTLVYQWEPEELT